MPYYVPGPGQAPTLKLKVCLPPRRAGFTAAVCSTCSYLGGQVTALSSERDGRKAAQELNGRRVSNFLPTALKIPLSEPPTTALCHHNAKSHRLWWELSFLSSFIHSK